MARGEEIEGSCLCGEVGYSAEGPLIGVARCHCEQCRKASGAEFATNGSVHAASFRVRRGEASLRAYESSPGQERVFCGRCGSPLFNRKADQPELIRLRLGCLDSAIEERPAFHVFVSEKPGWSEISDPLPQFDTRPK